MHSGTDVCSLLRQVGTVKLTPLRRASSVRTHFEMKGQHIRQLCRKLLIQPIPWSRVLLKKPQIAATQEFLETLWDPKVRYRIQKSPPLVPILCQINPVHTTPSHSSKVHFNIIFLYLGLPSGLVRNPVCILHSHACYMPCPSHPAWPEHANYIWWRVMKLIIMQFSPAYCYLIPLRSKYSPQHQHESSLGVKHFPRIRVINKRFPWTPKRYISGHAEQIQSVRSQS
jgi:hypothetical protein